MDEAQKERGLYRVGKNVKLQMPVASSCPFCPPYVVVGFRSRTLSLPWDSEGTSGFKMKTFSEPFREPFEGKVCFTASSFALFTCCLLCVVSLRCCMSLHCNVLAGRMRSLCRA